MVNGRGIVDRISSNLGPRWFLLITELQFLPIAYRKDLEKIYPDTQVRNRGENFKNCALYCIGEWMKTPRISRLSDGDRIRMLLCEVNRLKDFQGLAQEIAAAEDIDLSDTSFLDQYQEQVTVPGGPYLLMEAATGAGGPYSLMEAATGAGGPYSLMEATEGVGVSVTRTVTDVVAEVPHSQMEPWPRSDVVPMLSPRGAPWSYGDERAPAIPHPMMPQPVTLLPRDSEAEIRTHGGVAIRSNGSKLEQLEQGVLLAAEKEQRQGVLVAAKKEWGGLSGAFSDGGSTTSIGTYVQEVSYDTPIRIRRTNHKFPILDVCQRIPGEKWRENGKILGLDDVYLSSLEEEDVAERYYLMLKRWVELLEGTATFSKLREHLEVFGGDTALLVLEARLANNEEILIKAIQHDFL